MFRFPGLAPRAALGMWLLPRLAAGSLSPFWTRQVVGWIAQFPELAAAYEALRQAERRAGGDAPVSAAQRDVLRALVVPPAREPSRAWVPGISGALAASSLALFLVVGMRGRDMDLAARGSKIAQAAVGVKVSCVDADGVRVLDSATGGVRQSGARLECRHGSLLAFSTTNLSSESRHVFVVGVGPQGELRWYAPFSKDGAALRVAPGEVDAVQPVLADTRAMPNDASVTLHVLVSDEPFDGATVARQLARSKLPLDRLDRLPVDVPLQARIDMVSLSVAR